MALKTVFQTIRGPFLVLTPACVFLGIATVSAQGLAVDAGLAALVLIGALLAHISVNTFNEYFDLKSGLDLNTVRTPFSGGSGALPAQPQAAPAVLAAAVVSLGLTALIGLYFIGLRGWAIAPLGLLGLALVVSYTPWLNRSPLACLIAPGLGFGVLMVGGTHFVLAGSYAPLAWLAAAVPFFQVSNLLLLNQLPDLEADAGAGRRHLAIRHGPQAAARTYGAFALAAPAVVVAGVALGHFPALCLIALLSLPLALFSWRGALRLGERIGEQPAYLAANVAVAVGTPVLLGVGLILGV